MSAELLFFLVRANSQAGVRQTEQIPTGHLPAALVKLLALTTSQMDLSCPLTSLNGASPFLQQAA